MKKYVGGVASNKMLGADPGSCPLIMQQDPHLTTLKMEDSLAWIQSSKYCSPLLVYAITGATGTKSILQVGNIYIYHTQDGHTGMEKW